MKFLIASDIHGSGYWCEKLVEAFAREGADRLILLGDTLYHGPRNPLPLGYEPPKVAALLNERAESILCVRGNCDSDVDQMVLDFPIMADYALIACGERLVYITHGHIFSSDAPPRLHRGDILIHGHTHVPSCRDMGSFTYINPGSAALPKEDFPNSYLILEDGLFTWKDMEGREFMNYQL